MLRKRVVKSVSPTEAKAFRDELQARLDREASDWRGMTNLQLASLLRSMGIKTMTGKVFDDIRVRDFRKSLANVEQRVEAVARSEAAEFRADVDSIRHTLASIIRELDHSVPDDRIVAMRSDLERIGLRLCEDRIMNVTGLYGGWDLAIRKFHKRTGIEII